MRVKITKELTRKDRPSAWLEVGEYETSTRFGDDGIIVIDGDNRVGISVLEEGVELIA